MLYIDLPPVGNSFKASLVSCVKWQGGQACHKHNEWQDARALLLLTSCGYTRFLQGLRGSEEMAANPPQLVNYLWGQSSQLTGEPVLRCHTSPRTCSTSTPGIYSDCSTTPSIAGEEADKSLTSRVCQ
eukprot:5602468-Amphidinium_carterae.1